MKYKTLLLLSIFSLPQILQAQTENKTSTQPTDKAEIRVTYGSLQKLITTLGAKPEASAENPPIPATLRSVSYHVQLKSKQQAEVTATFTSSVFTDRWHPLPIFNDGVSISEIEPTSTVIIPHKGMLCLLTEKAGEYNFTLKFLIPAEVDGSFPLDFTKSITRQIHLENAEGYEVANAMKTASGSYLLPANGNHAKIIPKRTTSVAASSWSAHVKVLYAANDTELQAEARIQLTAKQGDPATIAIIDLPKDARVIDLSSPDLSSWKQLSSNQIEIQWNTHAVSRRRVKLLYTVPLPNTDETWSLAMPHLDKGQPTKGQIAVYTAPELQLSSEESSTTQVPSSIPDWMKEHGLPFIVTLSEAKTVNLSCQRLSQVQTATATIQDAVFRTQIVADGSTLSNGLIEIKHGDPKPITLKLPANSEILTCSIDNSLASPILLSDGSLQLHLPNKSKTDNQTTDISISFTSKLNELDPIEGKLPLSLPSTKLFIHQLEWYITTPSAYEVTALEGNLEFSPKPARSSNTILLIKQLSRNQAAQTDIFYRKKNL